MSSDADEAAIRAVARLIEVFADGEPSRVGLALVRDGRRVTLRVEVEIPPVGIAAPTLASLAALRRAFERARAQLTRGKDGDGG